MDGTAAEPGCGFDRRPARAPRSPPQAGHLRADSGKYRGPRGEHPLDHHWADDEARWIPGRISGVLAGASGGEADLGKYLQSAARRKYTGNAYTGRAAA